MDLDEIFSQTKYFLLTETNKQITKARVNVKGGIIATDLY